LRMDGSAQAALQLQLIHALTNVVMVLSSSETLLTTVTMEIL